MADSVEIDLIIKALSEGFEKVSGDLDKLGKSTEAPAEPAKKTSLSFTDLKSALDLVTKSVKVAGQAIETAFNFVELGATVTQTEDSFSNLINTIGAAPNLLNQLKDAAGGTISDLSLMSSTATLLAGTSGDLATNLANATPELLEIARAANKLNPSLGDTAFLYESISKGIKRASPLILDNLGIVVKVGEANKIYAEQLGKSVKELTAAEKQQALLNATLKSGKTLIEQAGGSAGNAVDPFNQLTTSITNLKNALAASVANTKVVQAQTKGLGNNLDATTMILNAQREGLISTAEAWRFYAGISIPSEMNETIKDLTTAVETAENATHNLEISTTGMTYSQLAAADATDNVNVAVGEWAENTFYAARALELQADNTYKAYISSEKFADRLQLVNDKAVQMTDALHNAQPPVEQLLDTLDQDISSPLSQFIDDLQFFIASGGQDFQAAFEAIKGALAKNQITAEEAAGFSGELLASIENVKVAAGEITLDEAAQNIADTLNVSLEDALGLLNNVGTAMDVITNVNREVSLDTSPLESAYDLMMSIENSVDNITGSHNVHFNISTSGAIPSVGGSGAPTGGSGSGSSQGLAGGADFIVPPGYPNDSYGPLYVQSGERVQVTPAGQAPAMNSAPPIVQVFLDSQQIAAVVRVQQGQEYRQRAGSGFRP